MELISPVPGQCPAGQVDPEALTAADFEIMSGEKTGVWGRTIPNPQCVKCPGGTAPHRSHYDDHTGPITILQFPQVCAACPLKDRCPKRQASGWVQVTINIKQVRLINRRRHQQTDEFRTQYRVRSGIEATNSILKRTTGLGRVRVRGRPAVYTSILLKVAGWNLLRASSVRSLVAKLSQAGKCAYSLGRYAA